VHVPIRSTHTGTVYLSLYIVVNLSEKKNKEKKYFGLNPGELLL